MLPEQLPVLATYRLARRHRDIVYLAGHVSATLDGRDLIRGKVGAGLTLEQAQEAARTCALHMLSTLRAEIGSLDQVAQILKVFGMVNVAPGFTDTPTVINGCSDLLVQVFGDAGRHARSAIGVAELPFGICVEIELEAEILN